MSVNIYGGGGGGGGERENRTLTVAFSIKNRTYINCTRFFFIYINMQLNSVHSIYMIDLGRKCFI